MLVLNRKQGQSVNLSVGGQNVGTIKVKTCRQGSVQLGFDFPVEVVITRPEKDAKSKPEAESV